MEATICLTRSFIGIALVLRMLLTVLILSLALLSSKPQARAGELSFARSTELAPQFLGLLEELTQAASPGATNPRHQLIQQLLVDHIFSSQISVAQYIHWLEQIEALMWEGREPAYLLMVQLQARWERLHLSTYQSCFGGQIALVQGSQGASTGAVLTLASILIPQVDQRIPLYLKLFRHSFPLFGAHLGSEKGQRTQEKATGTRPECGADALWPAPAQLVTFSGSFWGSSQDWLESLAFDQLIYGAMAMSISFSTYELIRKLQLGLKGVSWLSRSALLAGVLVSAGAFAAEKGTQQALELKSLRHLEQSLGQALHDRKPEQVLESARALAHFHALDFYRQLHLWEEASHRRRVNNCPEQTLRQSLGEQALQQTLNTLSFAGCQWNYSAYQALEEVKHLGLSSTKSRHLSMSWPAAKRGLLEHLRYQFARSGQTEEGPWIQLQQNRMTEALALPLNSAPPSFCRDSAPALLFQLEVSLKKSIQPSAVSPSDLLAWDLTLMELAHLRRSLEFLPKAVHQAADLSCSAN